MYNNKGMVVLGIVLLSFVLLPVTQGADSFYNPDFDYSRFPGRVTDKNEGETLVKIATENNNIRFFKNGDPITMVWPREREGDDFRCDAVIRAIEEGYMVLFVSRIRSCLPNPKSYFRRGTQMKFHSPILAQRVLEVSRFRQVLIEKRRGFLEQLNEINSDIWSFKEKKLRVVGEYEREKIELDRKKQKELRDLDEENREKIHLQNELIGRLKTIEQDMDFYQVSEPDILADRWSLDHDLALPMGPRPPKRRERFFLRAKGKAGGRNPRKH